jgi:hypothetical protein
LPRAKCDGGIPSWAPDWSTALSPGSVLDCQFAAVNFFKASTQRNSSFSLLDSENVLLVDGLYFDIIEGLGIQFDPSRTTSNDKNGVAYSADVFSNWICTGFGLGEYLVDCSIPLKDI